ncbi:MAG: hypothetical protein ACUVWR_10540 [Anaerolineae bacterium]
MRNELCDARADNAPGVTDAGLERLRLTKKRLVTKEDGRYLIFYDFGDDQQPTEEQS